MIERKPFDELTPEDVEKILEDTDIQVRPPKEPAFMAYCHSCRELHVFRRDTPEDCVEGLPSQGLKDVVYYWKEML